MAVAKGRDLIEGTDPVVSRARNAEEAAQSILEIHDRYQRKLEANASEQVSVRKQIKALKEAGKAGSKDHTELVAKFDILRAQKREWARNAVLESLRVLAVEHPGQLLAMSGNIGSAQEEEVKAASHIAEQFTDQSLIKNHLVEVERETDKDKRSNYNGKTKKVNLWPDDDVTRIIHEIAHHIEDHNPDLLNNLGRYLEDRVHQARKEGKDVELKWLGGNYKPHEVAWTNVFNLDDPYWARDYGGFKGELLSMGLEHLVKNPAMLVQREPHLFHFLFDTLRGEKYPPEVKK